MKTSGLAQKAIVLELFSGTGSVSKVCSKLNWNVTSLDLKDADINTDIMKWDYKIYKPGHFDIIWASPPCTSFSTLRTINMYRDDKTITLSEVKIKQDLVIRKEGLPILLKTLEIIDYLRPKFYFIENPKLGLMKDYINAGRCFELPFYDVDYCQYSNWGYKKPTRIWTNVKGFNPKKCHKKCPNKIIKEDGSIGRRHKIRLGSVMTGVPTKIPKKEQTHQVPFDLILDLLSCCF